MIAGIYYYKWFISEMDESSAWWAAVVSVAVYWLIGDDENAERSFPMVDSFPKKLQHSE